MRNKFITIAVCLVAAMTIIGTAGRAQSPGDTNAGGDSIAKSTSQTSQLPTLYIIGDSTVKNGNGDGAGGLWGWGEPIATYFDKTKINVENRARGGRSSRTFQTEGLWDQILSVMKPGDFVLMQFGHNDGGPLNTGRARGTLSGPGDETKEVVMEATGKKEVVHTFGWYMRKFIADAKAKGATPIVLSLIPRNMWTDGKVNRASNDYGMWAAVAARAEGAAFVDLNEIIAKHYDEAGPEKVKTLYFLEDHTHTTMAGALLNAASVIEGIKGVKKCPLTKYLLEKPEPFNPPPSPPLPPRPTAAPTKPAQTNP